MCILILFNMLTMSIQREEERLNFFKYEHVKLHYYSRTVKCAKQIKLSFEIEYDNSTWEMIQPLLMYILLMEVHFLII